MNRFELKSIATKFRSGMLKDRESGMMCFAVCSALQGYLSFLGVNTELVEADFPTTNHVWLTLPNGDILDPTADQFSGPKMKLPKVYIGPLPSIYKIWMEKSK